MPVIDVQLVHGPVSPDAAPLPADTAQVGGECVFLGRTRNERHPEHGDLLALDYDAYGPMAAGVMSRIARDTAAELDCAFVAVRHSLGRVAVGEVSVLIRVGAGHRDEAFRACRRIIDQLKAEAPIWKREHWADGATWQDGAPVPVQENE